MDIYSFLLRTVERFSLFGIIFSVGKELNKNGMEMFIVFRNKLIN